MNRRWSRLLFLLGYALVAAAAVRAIAVLFGEGRFDPWDLILIIGCLSLTIGISLIGGRPKGS